MSYRPPGASSAASIFTPPSVRRIRWEGDPYPGAKIDHNLLIVPNFGKAYFGELLISATSKRLTMLRLELGSPAGGSVACASIENDGGWSV